MCVNIEEHRRRKLQRVAWEGNKKEHEENIKSERELHC